VTTVLSLGQCAADHAALSWLLRTQLDAEVTAAAMFEDALTRLRQGGIALVLVNRVLDYDGSSSLEFITQIKADESRRDVPVMLVSNYANAQKEAVALGALPGFGKAALREPRTLDCLRIVLSGGKPEGEA
jgi:two-component system chemotaxis response regulator CheY